MQLQIGDKVSFINERRNGVVKKIINPSTVSVEIEDGFEIPVLIKELYKISSGIDDPIPACVIQEMPAKKIVNIFEEKEVEEANDISSSLNEDDNKKEILFLCFEPKNQHDFLADGFNMYFVNHTPYDVLFTCYHKQENKFKGVCYDAVSPMTRYRINEIGKEELNDWSTLLFHVIFYSEKGLDRKAPLEKEINVNIVKFFNANNFVYSKMLDSKCFLEPIYEEVIPEKWEEEKWHNEKINTIPARNIKELRGGNTDIKNLDKKYIVAPYIAEVDLHIEQLVDNEKDLNNHEKLNIQLDFFSRCLDAAIVHKYKKITFIHGVGQGRLKDEILKVISESYPGVKIQDAPFKKFGVGATEVLIPFNLTT